MRRGSWPDVVDQLTHTSAGGLLAIEGTFALEAATIAAHDAHARYADLGESANGQELLAHIYFGLALPKSIEMTWEAMEEALARPSPALSAPILIAWPHPNRLYEADRRSAEAFVATIKSVATERRERGLGTVLIVAPAPELEQMSDLGQSTTRLLVWQVEWTSGFDSAWVELAGDRMHAAGLIAAQANRPYTAQYELETGKDFVTRRLSVEARSGTTTRHLDLQLKDGAWLMDGEPRPDLELALDCDLHACPLTNTMPILRHRLHQQPGEVTLSMAFVRLPDLEVVRSEQTYTHLRLIDGGGAVVRYASEGFEADLVIDGDGLVVEYPKLGAHRVEPQP